MSKSLSVNMVLLLCKAASMLSKGTPLKAASADPAALKALHKRGLLHEDDENVVPTMEGFREVKGLAPVPMVLVHEDNAKALAPTVKAAFLKATGKQMEKLFGDEIATLGDLRREMSRATPGLLSLIDVETVSTSVVVYPHKR